MLGLSPTELVDGRGKHGHQAVGDKHGRWNDAVRRITSGGYIAVRVSVDYPGAWGPPGLKRFKYAYEHDVVMTKRLGRPLREDERVHHRNGDKTDNADENLELMTVSEHAKYHSDATRKRDTMGRYL